MLSRDGFRFLLRHDGWGTATLQAVRLIAQREIPAYAGMTWEGVGMTRPGRNDGMGVGMMRPGGNDTRAHGGLHASIGDSRLRGNDVGGCGNDGMEAGMMRPSGNDGEDGGNGWVVEAGWGCSWSDEGGLHEPSWGRRG